MTQPIATVMLTRRSWAGICANLIEYAFSIIDERDPSGIMNESLEEVIKDYVQKIIPIIYHAADKIEWPELEQLYKDLIRASGYAVPEHYEDFGKQLVQFSNGE